MCNQLCIFAMIKYTLFIENISNFNNVNNLIEKAIFSNKVNHLFRERILLRGETCVP